MNTDTNTAATAALRTVAQIIEGEINCSTEGDEIITTGLDLLEITEDEAIATLGVEATEALCEDIEIRVFINENGDLAGWVARGGRTEVVVP